jgi:hypothetical protein
MASPTLIFSGREWIHDGTSLRFGATAEPAVFQHPFEAHHGRVRDFLSA